MTDSLLKNISALAREMQGLARQAHGIYTAEVDAVLRGKCRDAQRIEHLRDGILGFCFDDEMLQLFKKLCRHYYAIDPAATADYVSTYRDMWGMAEKAAKTSRAGKRMARKPRGKKGGGE